MTNSIHGFGGVNLEFPSSSLTFFHSSNQFRIVQSTATNDGQVISPYLVSLYYFVLSNRAP